MSAQEPAAGRVHGLQVSQGGVPKLPVDSVEVTPEGIVGDVQRNRQYHGGPQRAVCLLAREVITALREEGHPIQPGTTGENITLEGLGTAFEGGARLRFEGGVTLEITKPAVPCSQISASFHDGKFRHLSAKRDPTRSRHYARVTVPGRITVGERVWREPTA